MKIRSIAEPLLLPLVTFSITPWDAGMKTDCGYSCSGTFRAAVHHRRLDNAPCSI